MIFLSRFIDGITAGNLSLAQAYISDVTQPKDRAKAFGIIGIFLSASAFSWVPRSLVISLSSDTSILSSGSYSFTTSIVSTAFLLPRMFGFLFRPTKKLSLSI